MAERARLVTGPVVSLLLITSRKGLRYVAGSKSRKSSTWFKIVLRSWKVLINTSYSSFGNECEPHRVLRRMAVTSIAISPCTTKIPFPGSDILIILHHWKLITINNFFHFIYLSNYRQTTYLHHLARSVTLINSKFYHNICRFRRKFYKNQW